MARRGQVAPDGNYRTITFQRDDDDEDGDDRNNNSTGIILEELESLVQELKENRPSRKSISTGHQQNQQQSQQQNRRQRQLHRRRLQWLRRYYEDVDMPAQTYNNDDTRMFTSSEQREFMIQTVTTQLIQAIQYNTTLEELMLNFRALEFLNTGNNDDDNNEGRGEGKEEHYKILRGLSHFLENAPNLRHLHIRIPSSCRQYTTTMATDNNNNNGNTNADMANQQQEQVLCNQQKFQKCNVAKILFAANNENKNDTDDDDDDGTGSSEQGRKGQKMNTAPVIQCSNLKELVIQMPISGTSFRYPHPVRGVLDGLAHSCHRSYYGYTSSSSAAAASDTDNDSYDSETENNNEDETNRRRPTPTPHHNHHRSYYDLTDLAMFIAQQPVLEYVRIQGCDFCTVDQWNVLLYQGLAKCPSLKVLDLRRIYPAAMLPVQTMSLSALSYHPTLESIQIDYCTEQLDWNSFFQLQQNNIKIIDMSKEKLSSSSSTTTTTTTSLSTTNVLNHETTTFGSDKNQYKNNESDKKEKKETVNGNNLLLLLPQHRKFSWTSSRISAESIQQLTNTLAKPYLKTNAGSTTSASTTTDMMTTPNYLTHLEIWQSSLAAENKALMLANMLKTNNTLLELNLTRASLSAPEATAIAESLCYNTTLKRLILTDNTIWKQDNRQHGCFQSFKKLLSCNTTLEYLDLSGNMTDRIADDHHFAALFEGLFLASRTSDLPPSSTSQENDDMMIADDEAQVEKASSSVVVATTPSIEQMDDDSNTDEKKPASVPPHSSVSSSTAATRKSSIKVIKLSNEGNIFQDALLNITEGHRHYGCRVIEANAIISETIGKVLSLSSHQQSSLTELDLNFQRLGDEAVATGFAPGLRDNSTLQILKLRRVGLGDAALEAFAKALENNVSLEYLDISMNSQLTSRGFLAFRPTLGTMKAIKTFLFHQGRHVPENSNTNVAAATVAARREGAVPVAAAAAAGRAMVPPRNGISNSNNNNSRTREHVQILESALETNYTLVHMSGESELSAKGKMLLEWNNNGRRWYMERFKHVNFYSKTDSSTSSSSSSSSGKGSSGNKRGREVDDDGGSDDEEKTVSSSKMQVDVISWPIIFSRWSNSLQILAEVIRQNADVLASLPSRKRKVTASTITGTGATATMPCKKKKKKS